MLNSYSRNSSQVNKELSYSKITTNVLHPKITSTPYCISPSKYRKLSPLFTPRRFMEHRCNFQLSSNETPSSLIRNNDASEPMLTSTSYNVNVSNCIHSKSPGYTGRLIEYNEESSRDQQLTHQEKYKSPELFTSVHLFKNDVPIITPKPKYTTVQIGVPDIKAQYSQEHTRLILEDIVRTNSVIKKNCRFGNDLSPRSLGVRKEPDLLNEIPRKRTHDTEEYERDDSNKKLRGNSMVNGDGDSSKRNREVDATKSDACTSQVAKPAMEKLCTIDAVVASKTSSMYANCDIGDKRKIVGDKKAEESQKKKKFNDADTQTVNASPLKTISVSTESNENIPEQKEDVDEQTKSTIVVEESPSPPKQVLKVFDDKRLEIIRKNRLRFLLSAMTGQEIPPIPMEDRRKALDQEWRPKTRETELDSILPSPDKSPTNSDISEK